MIAKDLDFKVRVDSIFYHVKLVSYVDYFKVSIFINDVVTSERFYKRYSSALVGFNTFVSRIACTFLNGFSL